MRTLAAITWSWILLSVLLAINGVSCKLYANGIDNTENKDFLDMSIEELMQVEITSSARRPQSVSRSSQAVYIITAEDIKQAGPTKIEDLFRMVPGMDVFQNKNLSTYIGSRGYTKWNNERMQILLDGRPLYDPYLGGSSMYLNPIFLENIERIEIIRGSAGVAWGVNAMSGVINIITKDTSNTTGGFVSGSYGSSETYNGLFRYGREDGPLSWRGTMGYLSNDGFTKSGGLTTDDDYDALQGTFKGRYNATENDTFTFSGGQQHAVSNNEKIEYMSLVWNRILDDGSSWEFRWTESFIKRYDQKIYYAGYYKYNEDVHSNVDTFSQEEILELKHNFEYDNHNIVWGADYTRDIYKSFSSNGQDNTNPGDFSNDQGSGYIQDEITLTDNLWLTLGYRGHYNELTHFDWAGNASLVWEFQPKHFLRGSISRSFRRPTMWQEFRAGPVVSYSSGYSTTINGEGNDSLKNETMISYELGYRGQLTKFFSLNVEGYLNQDRDMMAKRTYIQGVQPWLPGSTWVEETYYEHWENTYDITTYGLETSFEWKVNDWWLARGFYNFLHQDKRDCLTNWTTGKTDIILSPKHRIGLTNRFKVDKSTTLNTQLYWTDVATPNLQELQGRPFWKLDVRLSRRLWNDQAELAVGAKNLFNNHHYEGGYDWGARRNNEVPSQYYIQFSYRF